MSEEQPNVKIYTTPTCAYCKRAKEFLKEHQVEFQEIDVAGNREAAEEMIEKSGQMGTPVIEVNGTIIVGFKPDLMKKELNLT
ncbi:glutaredoxin [candidate division MSBL1 archaeon SCGC-AAA261F19]|uniref:Glutaredoxin n=1 Tax=candidate division MSBL1 archaeon SCGC-AAA261F19 TaxID=1698275 RepID=A0A133V8Z2_9EURY|nr:glutaredoxin [candidate division MSBL1 archaeon SCGC-AAA261F19]